MISKFFIDRPVLANVLAAIMVVIGAVALYQLPVAQYPNVVPPTVSVTTRYPGASASTVMETVALPIEQQVNGVDRMLYMQSTSTNDGTYTLTVTFEIGTDLNLAQILVQNRVSSALAALPQPVQAQGVTVQQKSTAILLIATLTSRDARHDSLYLSNYATINLLGELARVPGVANVNIFGAGQYAMRIWMDPEKLQARGLTPNDVIQSIQQQSQQVAAGQVGTPPVQQYQGFQYTVNLEGRLDDQAQFADIIIKTDGAQAGRITRLRDIARVELGAQTYSQVFQLDGRPAAGIAVFQTPSANALDVADRVRARLAELSRDFPQGVEYGIPFDTTRFVRTSIHEVYATLIQAAVLVLVVILVFLQDWRATLVPATTVPVTIIGTFAAIAALGFTVNLSTLFAIVLAIGIVVDDAIVVVEGAARHMERGLSSHDAAVTAMRELTGPIAGITLVLIAVFVPAAFLPGLTGRIYAQFALVMAATALISAINAATLKPTQCALWLRRPVPQDQRNRLLRGFNRGYDALERGYARLIGWMAGRSLGMGAVALILAGLGIWGIARLPTAFIPIEDQGYVVVGVQLPDGASLERTREALSEASRIARATPGVEQVIEIAGLSVLDNNASLSSSGVAYVMLKDWSERGRGSGQDLRSLYFRLQTALDAMTEAEAFVIVPPPIQGIGNASGFTMQVELRDGSFDYGKLQRITQGIIADGQTQSGLQRLVSSFRAGTPQLRVVLDRAKAETLGVAVGDVFAALGSYLGSSYVNQFNKFGRTFQVYVQADSRFRRQPEDILRLNLRSQDGQMVPLGAFAQVSLDIGPSLIGLYNLHLSASIVGAPAPGFSSGQALDLMERIAERSLPPGAGYEWTAMSFQEKALGNQVYLLFGLAVLLVYLCLAGLYESWIAPLPVILAVPLALIGPALALASLGLANNLYTQIGLVLLIALASKNAILIVEVARERRIAGGEEIVQAAVAAARARLRPIVMTSLAFILGVLPLVLASGAGASARASLGLSVFSGMLASTGLAVLFVPSLFVLAQRLEEGWKARRRPGELAGTAH
ncbi:efflux RND transporter permease subunit [Siccirubricoccus sp. G192]|uniref:efflux RND transporter permease subunit n=1 Tax=Siccirubricoccus sp. G192 TaxID=2849651 RepID=UPI001C2C5F0C|nr:efflux RND transporter permease subunit [Siccirubricoccus sp. G192]MBV1799442.1 efflux RND transporter permease subunit [Siccirubricoccus sp. G192]